MVLVVDRQVDCLEQDRVVAVVFVDVLRDLDLLVDTLDLSIDSGQKLLIVNGGRE